MATEATPARQHDVRPGAGATERTRSPAAGNPKAKRVPGKAGTAGGVTAGRTPSNTTSDTDRKGRPESPTSSTSAVHEEIDKYCGAKKRQAEGFCRRPAGWGTDHVGIGRCKLHGGATRTQRTHASTVAVERGAAKALRARQVQPVTDPIRQLSLLAGELVALKDVLGDKVHELKAWSYVDTDEREHVRALLGIYERVLNQTSRVLTDMAKLDLDARLVRLNEAQADLLERVVERVITADELGLDRDRQTAARAVLVRELSFVSDNT